MATPRRTVTSGARSSTRRRASHSLEAVVSEAVALLDEAGEPALTVRALASRLGGGAASIYWYVASRDELLDRAADHVLADLVADTESFTGSRDPIDDVQAIAVALFHTIVERPWLAAYLTRDTGTQPNGLLLYERLGEQVRRLDLTPRQSLHAVSAVLGFVIGAAADLDREPPREIIDGTLGRDEYMARYTDRWRRLDPDAFPFVHFIVDEFAAHDDLEQFRAGLDLLLAGLRLQAARSSAV